jgi:hypothetical protein
MLVELKFAQVPMPLGQAAGAGKAPRFCAEEQASLAGAVPPLQVGHAVAGHGTQLSVAAQPGAVAIGSEVNSTVRHPDVAVSTGGKFDPVNVPNTGEAVFGPLYTVRKSNPFSMLNWVNVSLMQSPDTEAQKVIT